MKKGAFEPISEVQRAWNRANAARVKVSSAPVGFEPLYSLMKDDTLRNTSSDWRAHPEVLSKSRALMVAALRDLNLCDESVLAAMGKVPRHVFVDEAFYLRAYDDDALPIGYGQTISHPSTVARMVGLLAQANALGRVLEIGTGCGYQAAVLACCARQVLSIERVAPLYELARRNLAQVHNILPAQPQTQFGDGMLGWAALAPFDGIIIAAAGLKVPQMLLQQLRVGGVLVAPVQLHNAHDEQHLVRVTRVAEQEWQREVMSSAKFVPLLGGVQD
ncbi:MAG: protein-L-isoaspartate(D-aspartate) O-methyltransferase [Formosimonas sp.]